MWVLRWRKQIMLRQTFCSWLYFALCNNLTVFKHVARLSNAMVDFCHFVSWKGRGGGFCSIWSLTIWGLRLVWKGREGHLKSPFIHCHFLYGSATFNGHHLIALNGKGSGESCGKYLKLRHLILLHGLFKRLTH